MPGPVASSVPTFMTEGFLFLPFSSRRANHEQALFLRQIEATDGQIDTLVYELYGLTEEEIGIVEGI
jgi:hypothetical protein